MSVQCSSCPVVLSRGDVARLSANMFCDKCAIHYEWQGEEERFGHVFPLDVATKEDWQEVEDQHFKLIETLGKLHIYQSPGFLLFNLNWRNPGSTILSVFVVLLMLAFVVSILQAEVSLFAILFLLLPVVAVVYPALCLIFNRSEIVLSDRLLATRYRPLRVHHQEVSFDAAKVRRILIREEIVKAERDWFYAYTIEVLHSGGKAELIFHKLNQFDQAKVIAESIANKLNIEVDCILSKGITP